MNPGTFQGAGLGSPLGTISRYIQTPTISTSQTIAVPPGTQRIEALLCGGGGGGGIGGGGFGGCAIIEIPVTGSPLQVVIGAGGATNTNGSPTYVVSAGTRYAEVGGGGTGSNGSSVGAGRSGGGGGGDYNGNTGGGNGGSPPIGKLLWSIYPQNGGSQTSQPTLPPLMSWYNGVDTYFNYNCVAPAGAGIGGGNFVQLAAGCNGLNGSMGGGGGGAGVQHPNGASFVGQPGYGGGGAWYNSGGSAGSYGGGGARTGNGGSLTAVTIWGYTGFAGGAAVNPTGGGGGGMLSAGGNGSGGTLGGSGGNGGGGGGGGYSTGGAGGNGFAAIRFYL